MENIWLLAFSAVGINGVFLILVADRLGWPTFQEFILHSATAAWVQAIGSIGAIAAAAWVVNRQHMLEQDRRIIDRIQGQVALINGAMLILMSQYNVLLIFRKQIMEPERSNPARHFALPATQDLDYPHWIVDWQKLAFLIEKGAKDALMDCMLAHNAFHSASKSVKERNQIHRLEYQPRMEKSGLDFSVSVLIADIELAAGQRITQTIFASTNDLYDQIDFGIKHLAHAGYLAAEKFRDMYREHQIIGFNAPE